MRNSYFLLVATLFLVLGLSIAEATSDTKVDMVQDCSVSCPEPTDMLGPTGFGFVNFNQNARGDLIVVTSLKDAKPDTTYRVFLVCGPTHAAGCGFIDIGFLTTNNQGNGNTGAIQIPVGILQYTPFGAGNRTDHIDLSKSVGDRSAGVYAVSNINYIVPTQ